MTPYQEEMLKKGILVEDKAPYYVPGPLEWPPISEKLPAQPTSVVTLTSQKDSQGWRR